MEATSICKGQENVNENHRRVSSKAGAAGRQCVDGKRKKKASQRHNPSEGGRGEIGSSKGRTQKATLFCATV